MTSTKMTSVRHLQSSRPSEYNNKFNYFRYIFHVMYIRENYYKISTLK